MMSFLRWSLALGAFAAALTLGAKGAYADSVRLPDGAWWQALSPDGKVAAVLGMSAGFDGGYLSGAIETLRLTGKTGTELNTLADKIVADEQSFKGQQISDIVAQIDTIYRDHPKLVHTDVAFFLNCIASKTPCASAIAAQERAAGP
jgi:hypothetical protein